MPPAVRRLPIVVSALAVLALVLAGVAAAANGGFTPVTPHSPNAHDINQAYYLILGFTSAIFVIVEGALIFFILRFRSRGRGRHVEGPQIIGNTRLELIWTVVPVLILAAIAAFVFVKLPAINDVPSANAAGQQLNVQVQGRQFYWRYTYPGGFVSYDRMVVPVQRVVDLAITSPDVDHSWWIPPLGGKRDAIPGRTNHTWFKADQPKTYVGQCAELCGLQHALMKATVQVVPASQYEAWARQRKQMMAAPTAQLGAEEFGAVCAKCHYLKSSGPSLIGPNIGGNPLLTDEKGLTQLVTLGRGRMPAVGKGWTDVEIKSLVSYFKQKQGGGSGGSQG
jgi:cytochrome c oxidase subunit 2